MEVNTIKAGNRVHYDFFNEEDKHIIGEGVVIDVEHCDFGIGGIRDIITIQNDNNELIGVNNELITNIISY